MHLGCLGTEEVRLRENQTGLEPKNPCLLPGISTHCWLQVEAPCARQQLEVFFSKVYSISSNGSFLISSVFIVNLQSYIALQSSAAANP